MDPDFVDYRALWREAEGLNPEEAIVYFEDQLAYVCRDAYVARNTRAAVILRVRQGGFEYVFDHYTSLETSGAIPYSATDESRLVVAYGRSAPRRRARDDYRLRGWVGPTEKAFGAGWDKGHYIAHSIGGAVDGVEANVFVQRRDLNRGWSSDGKRFRQMERYCFENPGILCFARPIYLDGTARPGWVQFGIIHPDSGPEVVTFDNR
ncbi:MAG: hypothetical protein NTV05_03775 [Acidobacteria bacterium]|nr:hypothetical protein [Acidobacteriota bacterium]